MNDRPPFAQWLGATNDITRMFLAAGQIPDLINLAGGLPEPSLFPVDALADLARVAVANHSSEVLGYGAIEGLPALRSHIAERFSTTDLELGAENVLITTSGMQGLDLIGKALLDPGATIAVQSPAYLGALDAWRPRQPTLRPFFPEHDDRVPLSSIDDARFAYCVPNFSNPTGRLFPVSQREALVSAAHESGVWLVEDDPYGTLFYDGSPLPSLLSTSGARNPGPYRGPVIYLGTLSKQLVPGLRLGWIIASPEMISALTIAKQGADMCTSGLSQRIALDALQDQLDIAMVPDMLDIYRQRRDALCAAMSAHLGPWFTWERPVGGMFIWATAIDPNLDTDRLLEAAMQHKVCVTPGSVFDPTAQDHRSIRINFTYNPPQQLEEGVRRLAAACASINGDTILFTRKDL